MSKECEAVAKEHRGRGAGARGENGPMLPARACESVRLWITTEANRKPIFSGHVVLLFGLSTLHLLGCCSPSMFLCEDAFPQLKSDS